MEYHVLRPQQAFANPVSGDEERDACKSTLLVRIFAMFLSPIVDLHLSRANRHIPLDAG
jgi:hypothetical protein